MSWTTPADVRAQVQKWWDKGELLRPLVHEQAMEPRRLTLRGPASSELADQLDAVRAWIAALHALPRVRIEQRQFSHRVLGNSTLPEAVWVDTLDDALALIGRTRDARRFAALLQTTQAQAPDLFAPLQPWLQKRPLQALALCEEWPRLLQVLGWMLAHPRPGIYLRQVDIGGIDSKFIEAHRAVLAELLDLILPPSAIVTEATGVVQFCRRYGFADKPLRIRFRMLDPAASLLTQYAELCSLDQDIALTRQVFERLNPAVERVFITENEVNFLAFPPVPRSMVVFGAGYGFEALATAHWLHRRKIFYWGDIDTHGFAILDQLRSHFPHAQSLLMDRETLLAHPTQWVEESQPIRHDLPRLTGAERALYDQLRHGAFQDGKPGLRLEQERIGFGWVRDALSRLESG
ncbi:MAG: hypothetical protein K9K38_08135 [Rhodoferax sp.]|nr:hypothetical protein [Rhodoferax sp.]